MRIAWACAAVASMVFGSVASAKTYSFPHVLETSGRLQVSGFRQEFGQVKADRHDVRMIAQPPGGTETDSASYEGDTLNLSGIVLQHNAVIYAEFPRAAAIKTSSADQFEATFSSDFHVELDGREFSLTTPANPLFLTTIIPLAQPFSSPPSQPFPIKWASPEALRFEAIDGGGDFVEFDAGWSMTMTVPEPGVMSLVMFAMPLLRRRRQVA